MKRFRRILKKIFFLPPLPTVLIAVLGYGFVLLVFELKINKSAIKYLSYICSAYALIITVTGYPHFSAFTKILKRYIYEHPLMKKLRSTTSGERFFSDVRFRSDISLYQGLFINLLYIGMKIFSGVYYRSVWFISLACYYFFLTIMRLMLLRREKERTSKTQMEIELHRYRSCGIMLLMMSQTLAGVVILIVYQNKGFDYPGVLIYLMALYSFYSAITAVINLVKYRKHGSPIISAAKVINFVAAMVSILSLTTAMLARFDESGYEYRKLMTSLVGGGVCMIVIGMAIYMVWKSSKQIKQLQINNSQT